LDIDGESLIKSFKESKLLLAAHWDVDGICSVVKIRRILRVKHRFYTPSIGIYDIPWEELTEFNGYDYIVVMDMALPKNTIDRLDNLAINRAIVIDHHYHPKKGNAVYIDYPMENGDNFYSNTLLMDDFFRLEHDILTVLGIVGDYYTKVKGLEIYRLVEEISSKHGLNFDDIYRLTLLIDANHLTNDREAVYKAADVLEDNLGNIKELLNHDEWIERLDSVEGEIQRVAGEAEVSNDVIFHRFNSRYYIISKVGRRLTEMYPGKTVFLHNTGFSDEYDQLYIRVPSGKDLLPLIEEGLGRGFICGGKSNVAGFLVPKRDTREFIGYIWRWLEK